jgi:hypothetical protein
VLDAGPHYLIFEIGDVNDHTLDSAVFISNLRAGTGTPGTGETEDPPYVDCPHINAQPASTSACAAGSAPFSISATGVAPLRYQWKIRTAPETWVDLGVNPVALPCGGSASATSPNSPNTMIAINPCPGVMSYRIRCKVSNDCGDVDSADAYYTICYANCDCSTAPPALNVNDFICFMGRFAASDPFADCDASGALNVNDFVCFQNEFAAGCP